MKTLNKLTCGLVLAGSFTFLGLSSSAQIYGANVLSYSPKFQYDANTMSVGPVDPNRSISSNAIGAAQNDDSPNAPINFVSLGISPDGNGGSITIEMERPFSNGLGIDLEVTETTYGTRPCSGSNVYPERAKVWVAQVICDPLSTPISEPYNWFLVGEICGPNGQIDFDLSEAACLSWARYVHIKDISNPSEFLPSDGVLDGYDVDGIEGKFEVDPTVSTSGIVTGASVPLSDLGTQKGGGALPSTGVTRRNDVNRALGLPEGGSNNAIDALNSFVSLGFKRSGNSFMPAGGSIVIALSRPIFNQNGAGADLVVFETSYNSANKTCSSYPEHARVYGSCSAQGPWTELVAVQSNLGGTVGQRINGASTGGTTNGPSSICKDGRLDLGNLERISHVQIVDNTRPNSFPNSGDAFDVNAVVGIGQCDVPDFKFDHFLSMVPNEAFYFNAFPNPAADNFSIEIEASDVNEDIELQIIDFSGRVVRSENIHVNASSYIINNYSIGDLNNGMYMLVAKSKNATHVSKFIKMN
jgi:hypothetical protein